MIYIFGAYTPLAVVTKVVKGVLKSRKQSVWETAAVSPQWTPLFPVLANTHHPNRVS